MKLATLLDNLELTLIRGHADTFVRDVTDDSRTVGPGALFIAREGGDKFIDQAVARGATAVVGGHIDQATAGEIAERFFDRPSRKLRLVGITGTNGKTTIATIIQHLLRRAAMPCGLIGTIAVDDGRQRRPASLTTPGAVELSRLLAAMVTNGCRAAVMEVSSHALSQGRTAALDFDAAVFTNLTGDHLDYHQTMDAYLDAKAALFEGLCPGAWAIINRDDPYGKAIAERCAAHRMWCSLKDDEADCRATIVDLAADHSRARFAGPWGDLELSIPLIGAHNVANALQAMAAASAIAGIERIVDEAMEQCPAVPGRLEPVCPPEGLVDPGDHPAVLVDYAHTHDALENVLDALRPLTRGRLMVLFGCGGDRDRTKRPKMAVVACRLADVVCITSDNPRTENPQAIIDEILTGVPDAQRDIVRVEPDRAKAIAQLIAVAGRDDVVLLAGKGHEDYQIIGKDKRHFDDREQAATALQAKVART
jgi:UDP-N-acetylmuramoyl-L-alanyl-D-glutamate--2,6-diaminopimelate ligase